MEAAKGYNPELDFQFSTYAYFWVRKYILQSFRKEIRDDQAKWEYGYVNNSKDVAKSAYVQKHLEELGGQEQEILELSAKGYSTREIAEEMEDDISHMTVARRLEKIGFVTKRP